MPSRRVLKAFSYCGTTVRILPGWVETTLPDGALIVARPNEGAEHVARARSLGYGSDVWAMTMDHDPMHARLCHALGLRESPALRASLNDQPSEIAGAEEEMVLAAQRFVNLCRRDGLL